MLSQNEIATGRSQGALTEPTMESIFNVIWTSIKIYASDILYKRKHNLSFSFAKCVYSSIIKEETSEGRRRRRPSDINVEITRRPRQLRA